MADLILVWYIAETLSNNVQGENVGTEYIADEDYVPAKCRLRQKTAQAGDATIIDINDDGVSIFSIRPAVNQGLLEGAEGVFDSTLTFIAKGSVITLDVDQVSGTTPGSGLTVQLELNKL